MGARSRLSHARLTPFWLILPGLIIIACVQVYPVLFTFYLSLHALQPGTGAYIFRGFDNFQRLFATSLFIESLTHTAVFLTGYATLTLACALGLALLLRERVQVSALAITLLFIPWVLSDVIAGIVWRLFVVPEYGLFSSFFANPAVWGGERGISVLTSPAAPPLLDNVPFPPAPALLLLIVAAAWKVLPFITLLLLAALQTVPTEVLESARIDGASRMQSLRHITLPLIVPMLVVALVNIIIGGVNGVGMVFSLTSGGPGTATTVLSYLLYVVGFSRLDFGLASALSVCMSVLNVALVLITLRLSRGGEE